MIPFTLQQLRILKAVSTKKTFTKAAQSLYMSQPALSKQIKILEKNLGILLLTRHKNKIDLTNHGKIFLQYSERILALCEESCRVIMDLKNADRGNLRIGTTQLLSIHLIPRLLTLIGRQYPQINLKVFVNSTRLLTNNLMNQGIDMAIINAEIPKNLRQNIYVENFVEDEFHLIISRYHPFAKKKKITKDDLYLLNIISLDYDFDTKKVIEKSLIQNQIEPKRLKVLMQLNSVEGVKAAINLGLGASFVSSSIIQNELKLEAIKILRIENLHIYRKFYLINNPNSYKSKIFDFFYKELNELKSNFKN